MIEEVILDNAPTVAVCVTKGCKFRPFKNSNSKVSFEVKGKVTEALNAIYQNEEIPIGDYLRALSTVRNAIFTHKNMK